MTRMLRLLNDTGKGTWLEAVTKGLPNWSPDPEVPAGLLKDWCDNELSIWKLESENLIPILTALLYPRKDFKHVSYMIFEESILQEVGLRAHQRPGTTSIARLDNSYHYEVHELSSGKLARLIRLILRDQKERKVEIEKVTKEELARWIKQGIERSISSGTQPLDSKPTDEAESSTELVQPVTGLRQQISTSDTNPRPKDKGFSNTTSDTAKPGDANSETRRGGDQSNMSESL